MNFNNPYNQNGMQPGMMMGGVQQPVMQQPGMMGGVQQPVMQQPGMMGGVQQPVMQQPGMMGGVQQPMTPDTIMADITNRINATFQTDSSVVESMMTILIKNCIDSNRQITLADQAGNGLSFHRQLVSIGAGTAFELGIKQIKGVPNLQSDTKLLNDFTSHLMTKQGVQPHVNQIVAKIVAGTDLLIQACSQHIGNPQFQQYIMQHKCYVIVDNIFIITMLLDNTQGGIQLIVNTDLVPYIKMKIKNDAKLRV